MRLKAFRIENFRSIVDTGMQSISPDNITCLIGQNESGKTSILEGLKVFSSGEISEDVLRSDLSLPRVTCSFEVPEGFISSKLRSVNDEFDKLTGSLNCITLIRSWKADLNSQMDTGGELLDYISERDASRRKELTATGEKINAFSNELKEARAKKEALTLHRDDLRKRLDEHPAKARGLKLFRKKRAVLTDDKENTISELNEACEKTSDELGRVNAFLDERQLLIKVVEEWSATTDALEQTNKKLDEISLRLEERHQTMTLLSGPSLADLSHGEWEKVLTEYKAAVKKKEDLEKERDLKILLCEYIFKGLDEEKARAKLRQIKNERNLEYTSRELGELFSPDCPYFEIFEDFGSLLPNRIDMEDLIADNQNVEGYKAARNFLTLADLDYTFFQQPSSRILKQKIENLNAKLTLDFHDFWQQYVGRHNKIRINFELDHYSTNHGDKAGKPYLEFWVKDEGERLYPKQRSRGVRWFLSFYLELMAASKKEKKHLILLVDEPGVSLHARAQEDVLKVFEDIKDNIQVIYTTHSPHLVDINKLHRVLAVQRDDVASHKSATVILDAARLGDASPDTLSPLQSIMGNPVGNQEFSVDKHNVIVNNVGTFYMMNAAMKLTGYKGRMHFIPSTDSSSIPLMCNILMGWGMKFAVLLFHNEDEIGIARQLEKMVFTDKPGDNDNIIIMPEEFVNAEDLLSTLDFKNLILKTREGITVSNSEHVTMNDLPRNFLLSKFLSDIHKGKITRADLDEESKENLMLLINILQKFK
ncbi:MAG: AAA family ATPase [Bacteroidales bacterium]|nr:AAA family ATPase [Bacteroidales bacterium]